MDLINTLLAPLEWLVAWIMVAFHTVLTTVGLPAASGWTWALSIVGLVIVMRIILMPLFFKQIHASRKMQLIQPEMQKIQKKYKGKSDPDSRQAMQRETMDLYKRTGTNPLSSCLPILLQSPFFFALFRVLNSLPAIAGGTKTIGPMDKVLAAQAEHSSLFGAPLSSSFTHGVGTTRIVTVVLIALMSITTFTTQRQLMMKNMPASALDNPFAKQQKIMLYVLPFFFVISGINFPIGVLLYWLTTNLWSMGQQFYTIRRMPAPGSPAERALEERRMRRGESPTPARVSWTDRLRLPARAAPAPAAAVRDSGSPASGGQSVQDGPPTPPKPGQRQQPKRKNRQRPV